MKELKFEIVKHIGTITTNSSGWTKELNLVSFNDEEPKYDIREWDNAHKRMGKGIRLSEMELNKLKMLLELVE